MKTRLITTLALAAGVAALASCQKSELNPEAVKTSGPVSLTLRVGTAVPDAPDTKVTYTDNVTSISASWEAGDQISLVQLDKDGKALKAETFTAKTAGTTVDFEGTFTRDANAKSVTVVYPAVDPASWKSRTGGYGTELFYVESGDINTNYATMRDVRNMTFQSADGILPNLKDVTLMFCNTTDLAALESGSASVSLELHNYIVKMKVKVSGLATVKLVSLDTNTSAVRLGEWGRFTWSTFYGQSGTSTLTTRLGTPSAGEDVSGIAPDSDGCVTVYLVSHTRFDKNISAGKTLSIEATGLDASSVSKTLSYTATTTSPITFSPGYLYTLKGVKGVKELK